MTIGYRINEAYWHRGIAAETVRMLINSLYGGMGVQTLRA